MQWWSRVTELAYSAIGVYNNKSNNDIFQPIDTQAPLKYNNWPKPVAYQEMKEGSSLWCQRMK